MPIVRRSTPMFRRRPINYQRQRGPGRGLGYTAADLAMTTDPAMLAKLTLQEQINAGVISEVQATANAGGPINPCGNPEFAAAHPDYPNFNVDPASCNKTPGPLQVGKVATSAPASAPASGGGGSSATATGAPSLFASLGPTGSVLAEIPWWGWLLGVGGLGWVFFGRSK